ncbi:hypothetical protein D3C86_2069110 [compost metagenome]
MTITVSEAEQPSLVAVNTYVPFELTVGDKVFSPVTICPPFNAVHLICTGAVVQDPFKVT